MSLFASLFPLTVTHSYVVHSARYSCPGVAQYWLSFYGRWSAATHPNNFPGTPTHGRLFAFRRFLASAGIKAVAETGELFILQQRQCRLCRD